MSLAISRHSIALVAVFGVALAFSSSAEAASFNMVEGWWDSLDCPRMNGAVNEYDPDIMAEGMDSGYCVMYADLGDDEKHDVDQAAEEIGGDYDSIHLWWEALDCRKMSIATGYAQPAYCGHFVNAPKYNGMNGLTSAQEEVVAVVGYALAMGMPADFDAIMMSGLWIPFAHPALEGNFSMVEGWWNSLDCDRMNGAVNAYDDSIMAEGMDSGYCAMYADLRDPEKLMVHKAAMEIDGQYSSIHMWWEYLDCRKMTFAVGVDGYCGHFVNAPKYNGMNGLTSMQEEVVAVAGYALARGMTADFDEIMMSDLWTPFDHPMLEGNFSMVEGWWNSLDCDRMNGAVNAYDDGIMAQGMDSGYCVMYADLRDPEKLVVHMAAMEIDGQYPSIHMWWEYLDCRKMTIAVGADGYCGHFVNAPKANEMNTLTVDQEEVVAIAGYALATGMTATFAEIMASPLWQPFTPVPALPLVGLGILGLLLAGRGAWLRSRGRR